MALRLEDRQNTSERENGREAARLTSLDNSQIPGDTDIR